MSKIVYITHGINWFASIEPIIESLNERGHDVIICNPQIRGEEKIPEDVDVILLTSNVDQPIIHKNTKIIFIPHGIGDECWDSIMDNYYKVLLAGKRPWSRMG